MIFQETAVDGAFVVVAEPVSDERGSFARTFSAQEFRTRGLDPAVEVGAVSRNLRAHTLRGLHLQQAPHTEAKLVRCLSGSVFDVVVDVRPRSATYLRWHGEVLTAEEDTSLYVPHGCAHGFLTLQDSSAVLYQLSTGHVPQAARGYRWDDPAFDIGWPAAPVVINDRDAGYPLLPPAGPTSRTSTRTS